MIAKYDPRIMRSRLISAIGMTIHDVRFMDRDIFYRLSLSEMFVPYGDPRNPIYRKGAFDLGNVGAGVTANNLSCKTNPLHAHVFFIIAFPPNHEFSGVRLPWSDQILGWTCC